MICAFSPAARNRNETVSTLQFASRAKKIVCVVTQNCRKDQTALVEAYEGEIERLKRELLQMSRSASAGPPGEAGAGGDFSRPSYASFASGGINFNPTAQKGEVDHCASHSFTEMLRRIDADALEAEQLANALVLPGDPELRLRVIVGVGKGLSPPPVYVDVSYCNGDETTIPPPDPDVKPDWVTADELSKRLEWLRSCQAEASEEEQDRAWKNVIAADFNLWQAAAVATRGTPSTSPRRESLRLPRLPTENLDSDHGDGVSGLSTASRGDREALSTSAS